jgi:hypothetical protein
MKSVLHYQIQINEFWHTFNEKVRKIIITPSHLHHIFTTSSPHLHHIFTTSSPHLHHIFTTSSPHLHHIFTTSSPDNELHDHKEAECKEQHQSHQPNKYYSNLLSTSLLFVHLIALKQNLEEKVGFKR